MNPRLFQSVVRPCCVIVQNREPWQNGSSIPFYLDLVCGESEIRSVAIGTLVSYEWKRSEGPFSLATQAALAV